MADFQLIGIEHPHDNDVLLGRGNHVNAHAGNKRFRLYVQMQRELYVATPKCDKPIFAKMIVSTIRNLIPPGRFLMLDRHTKSWSDVGDRKAWDKTRQALREKVQKISDTTSPSVGKPVMAKPMDTGVPNLQNPQNPQNPQYPQNPQNSLDMSIASSEKLRSIFDRQLKVAELYPQFPREPSTRLSARWGEDYPLSSEDTDQFEVNNDTSEEDEAFIHDHVGRAFNLTTSFTPGHCQANTQDRGIPQMIVSEGNNRRRYEKRSSLKVNPKYSDAVHKYNNPSSIVSSSGATNATAKSTSDSSSTEVRFDFKSAPILDRGLEMEKVSSLSSSLMTEEGKQSSDWTDATEKNSSSTSMTDLRNSLLRASLLSCGSSLDDQTSKQSKEARFDMTKLDDIMSARCRRHSSILSRGSVCSNLTDLSLPSGRQSICENMSLSDSGIFSMNATQLADWQKEAAAWEREADMEEENQAMQDSQPNQDCVKNSIA